ncbi:hypothetical protein AAEJ42_23195, partial [Shewanella algae]
LAIFAFVPGFPTLTFLVIAGLCFAGYRILSQPKSAEVIDRAAAADRAPTRQPGAPAAPQAPAAPTGPEAVLPLLNVDPIEIE